MSKEIRTSITILSSFLILTVAIVAACFFLMQTLLKLDWLENGSQVGSIFQGTLGVGVAFAGSIVAIVLSRQAIRQATETHKISERQAMQDDPDYILANAAYRSYLKYDLLIGSLLASYREFLHTDAFRKYVSVSLPGEPKDDDGSKKGAQIPTSVAWKETLRQIQALLTDTAFVAVSFEAARLIDKNKKQENEIHNLRKAIANMLSAIERILEDEKTSEFELEILILMARAKSLDNQLQLGLAEIKSETPATTLPNLLKYFKEYVNEITPVETGEELIGAVLANTFEDEQISRLMSEKPKTMEESLRDIFNDTLSYEIPAKENDYYEEHLGVHKSLKIVTLAGDHQTRNKSIEIAKKFAADLELNPIEIDANNIANLKIGKKQLTKTKNAYCIYVCTARTLPFLFSEDGIPTNATGCVIVDGIQSAHLTWYENFNYNREDSSKSPKIIDLVRDFTDMASSKTLRTEHNKNSFYVKRENLVLSDKSTGRFPRITWIGLEYRILGEQPANRGMGANELSSIFTAGADGNLCLGVDAYALTANHKK